MENVSRVMTLKIQSEREIDLEAENISENTHGVLMWSCRGSSCAEVFHIGP